MGDRRRTASGSNSRASGNGDPNGRNQMHRRANAEAREMSISGKGYRGRANYISTHFAAMSDQWGNEGGSLITITSAVSEDCGNISRGPHILYSEREEGGAEWGYKRNALPLEERYAEVSRILRRAFLSPFEMFGILALPHERYIGDRTTEMMIGKGATKNGAIYKFGQNRKMPGNRGKKFRR